ncbi:hypothetical protein [Arthrobacter sp. JCM 19049]|uniref:hypothetical protein n=1 Tax=Arthrobacter sp. JCM 19049 TaxID=1460643 RepID=UPI000A9420C7|nr:hypothetical protein [Arthrobacter sp. JCM 19049]
MIEFNIPLFQVFTLLAAVVFPLLVGLVTKRATNPGRKAVLLAGLSVLISLCTELAAALEAGTSYNLGMALLTGLGSFLVAVAMHYGLWKPTGVADKLQGVGDSEPIDRPDSVPAFEAHITNGVSTEDPTVGYAPGQYPGPDPDKRGKHVAE